MRDRAKQFFHRVTEVTALFIFQIFSDLIGMMDQFERNEGQIILRFLQQIGCRSQVLLVLHIFRFDICAHLGIYIQIFQSSFEQFLIIHKCYIAFH